MFSILNENIGCLVPPSQFFRLKSTSHRNSKPSQITTAEQCSADIYIKENDALDSTENYLLCVNRNEWRYSASKHSIYTSTVQFQLHLIKCKQHDSALVSAKSYVSTELDNLFPCSSKTYLYANISKICPGNELP